VRELSEYVHAFKVHDGHVEHPYEISFFDEKITCPHCRAVKCLGPIDVKKESDMYISSLIIENFRLFGDRDNRLELNLTPGLTALVGENDEGKSAVIDAFRFILGTNDQSYSRIDDDDFHRSVIEGAGSDGETAEYKIADKISIQCKFSGLSMPNKGDFAEYLTYEDDGSIALYINWVAHREVGKKVRRWVEVLSGKDKTGPPLLADVRELLRATYLRPLRDAEREMSAGRNSRLSQILQAIGDINQSKNSDGNTLLEVSDEAFREIGGHPVIGTTSSTLNGMLGDLSFGSDILTSDISVSQSKDDNTRLRQLLEKLELDLREVDSYTSENRGLGSNNLLFMGCEMLLLEAAEDEVPIMLIEEPEAHIHPQRQLLVIDYLQKKALDKGIQILITTHSPQLASVINLSNLVLIKDRKAFSLGPDYTELDSGDYRFLERFLDATKANLFFSKGVLIVEGDAENILLPTIAKLIGRDFTRSGVSVVNVGHTGLGRFSRIFRRKEGASPVGVNIKIPVACVTDLDVLPACAPRILGLNTAAKNRRWKHKGEFTEEEFKNRKMEADKKYSGQSVKAFVSDLWTLEFDLANSGIFDEVWKAAKMAKEDENLKTSLETEKEGLAEIKAITESGLSDEEKSVHCYSRFTNSSTDYADGASKVSKSIAAQYLSDILESGYSNSPEELRRKLPDYIVNAIDYVTGG
jgi:putative ATP-dependent endonuclease of OLD family